MKWRLWAAVIGLASLCAVGDVSAAHKAKLDTSQAFKPNPAVVTGVLPNGLRYAVVHSDDPKGGLSLRLTIDAGLYDEEDSERGAAHFVEHMAFANGRAAGADDPIKAFEAAGVTFGRDQNAFTTPFATTYQLDLKAAEGPLADQGFRWLRSVADGTSFDDAAVDRERGVMLAERGTRASPTYEAGRALLDFVAPPSRARDRMDLDPVASLQAMTGQRLRGFYERWYRPERAVVVVVGDLPTEVLKKRVEAAFSSWAGKGPAPVRAAYGPPPRPRPFTVDVKATPHAMSQVDVCRALPSTYGPLTTVDSLKPSMTMQAWADVLDQRLAEATAGPQPPFTAAKITQMDLRAARIVCVTAIPIGDRWREALAAVQDTLAGLSAKAPPDDAAEASSSDQALGLFMAAYASRTPDLATYVAAALVRGDTVIDITEYTRVSYLAVDGFKGEDVRQAFRHDWPDGDADNGPLVAVYMPQPPTAAEVTAAWQGEARELAGPAPAAKPPVQTAAAPPQPLGRGDIKSGAWPYYDFGKPGRVVKREHVTPQGFDRYTFANGVILNIKSKGFDDGVVMVGVRFGGGRMELADDDVFVANVAAPLFAMGGLGRLDHDQMDAALKTAWAANLSIQADHFTLSGATDKAGLRTQLQVLAAFVTDPAFRPYREEQVRTGIDAVYRMVDSTPMAAILIGQDEVLAAHGPKAVPPREQAMAADSKAFARVLKPVLTGAPLEVNIAGNVDEGWAVRWVGETLGALPPRSDAPRIRPGAWVRRFPDPPPPAVRVDTPEAQGGAVAAFWPLYPADIAHRRDELALRMLAPLVDDAVRERIRWKLGKSYVDTVSIDLTDGPDQGFLAVAVSTSTEDVDIVAAEMPKAVEALIKGDIDPAAFERSRTAVKAQLGGTDMASSATWLTILQWSSREPGVFDDLSGMDKLADSITVDDLKRVAARWLAPPPLIIVAAPRKDPAGAR